MAKRATIVKSIIVCAGLCTLIICVYLFRNRPLEAVPFSELNRITSTLNEEMSLKLYEGLPHPRWDPDRLESERRTKSTFVARDFDFYRQPNPVSALDETSLIELIKSKNTFTEYAGPKFCGGYHPDFLLRWTSRKTAFEIEICFGCGEATVVVDGEFLHCDITREGSNDLEAVLENHFVHRQTNK